MCLEIVTHSLDLRRLVVLLAVLGLLLSMAEGVKVLKIMMMITRVVVVVVTVLLGPVVLVALLGLVTLGAGAPAPMATVRKFAVAGLALEVEVHAVVYYAEVDLDHLAFPAVVPEHAQIADDHHNRLAVQLRLQARALTGLPSQITIRDYRHRQPAW